MTIQVTGYRWKRDYEYLKGKGDLSGEAGGVEFCSTRSTLRNPAEVGTGFRNYPVRECD